MKHKSLDLASEIKRASLPAHVEGFLYPVFEAISNALHSIEDKFGEQAHENGRIKIFFDPDAQIIRVEDNGEGFSRVNLNAFLTPFTGTKLRRNGKGFGRFISFKIFSRVFYASNTEFNETENRKATFEYLPLNEADNLVEIDDAQLIPEHRFETGLTVAFHKPLEDYKRYFNFSSDDEYSEETLLVAIMDHFLLEFIQGKTPKSFICEIGGAVFNLSEYFSESVNLKDESDIAFEIDGKEADFNLRFMQIDAEKSKRHSLYFYADNRATSDLENIAKGLKDNSFEDDEGRRYNYLVAVTSPYFKATQSRDRISNLGVKTEHNGNEKPLKDALAAEAKAHILTLEPSYTGSRRSTIRKNVEDLIALDPMLRRGLGNMSIDEFVSERGITESREQLAQDLFVARLRSKFDFRKINSKMPFSELQKVVRDRIPADAKEALAIYVAYRNDVIKVLAEMLNRDEGGAVAKEDAVHELIYPRYHDSDEIDYSSHNLWLIDDDLAYAEYISSDRTPKGAKREKGSFAHDILVNNQNELLLVEMKRPQKEKFDTEEEARRATDNPVQQLVSQIGEIRDFGGVTTTGNRKIEVSKEHMIRGYIIADWNDDLERYLGDNDFIISNFGGPMAYRYYSTRNMMIEVLAFDRLKDRAAKRNEVFIDILNGRTNYAGLKVSVLAS
ncbi:MAG: ATP-binding protein [Pseudomonadota bacterium]